MHPQRVREAENRMVTQFVKWAAEGALKGGWPSRMRRKTYVSCQEYDGIPLRVRYFYIVNQGGTAGDCWTRP